VTRAGFTLIEMSIVLVIVGLVIGGILLGADLIKSAQIRGQVSELYKYELAVKTFRLKYNAMPGDISWRQAPSFGFSAINGVGNGNGTLDDGFPCSPTIAINGEIWLLFEQLSQANLVDKRYRDPLNFAGTADLGGVFPLTRIGRGAVVPYSTFNRRLAWFVGINTSSASSMISNFFNAGILTPIEAFQIDSKIDDGAPTSGIVRAVALRSIYHCAASNSTSPTLETDITDGACSTASTNLYNFSTTTTACSLLVDSR
jgi:prepilin-type N-terminal cleavage/methylation domain-containing protein